MSLLFSLQPDGISKSSQERGNIGVESDEEVGPSRATNKVYRRPTEEELKLEPLCDEVPIIT
jgi:hypothetical protein